MKTLIITACALLVPLSASGDLVDDVRCREIGFSRAAEQRDTDAFISFVDADARFVGNSVMHGVDEVAAAWSVFFGENSPTIKWRPQIVEVLENGALALTRGPYRVTTTDAEGNPVEQWGTFNSVWRLNEDGQWRVVFDAGSPAAAPPDDATRAFLDAEDNCP